MKNLITNIILKAILIAVLCLFQLLSVKILQLDYVGQHSGLYSLVLLGTSIAQFCIFAGFCYTWDQCNLYFPYKHELNEATKTITYVWNKIKLFFVLYPMIKGIIVVLLIVATICTLLHYLVFQYWQ